MPRIGFIGLGAMGKPMAKNLIKAGHELVVFSRSPGPCQELEKEGASVAQSAADVAAKVDLVITLRERKPCSGEKQRLRLSQSIIPALPGCVRSTTLEFVMTRRSLQNSRAALSRIPI